MYFVAIIERGMPCGQVQGVIRWHVLKPWLPSLIGLRWDRLQRVPEQKAGTYG